jgi:2-polyprenyl-3-methyl-5-hydroxy-6-metoxy-1,4-benzoquinol methylase
MQSNNMKEMWNKRAEEDAFFYVESAFWDGDIDKFFALGEERSTLLLKPVFDVTHIDSSNTRLLEIGCGVGRFSRAFAKTFKTVTAVDVSEQMINKASQLSPQSEYPNLTFQATDGISMSFISSETIDLVFSYEVFQHMPSPEIILSNFKEVGRVLTPTGYACIHIMNDYGIAKKTIKKIVKQTVPSFVWKALGISPFTFDKTWTGTSLSSSQIQEFCKAAGLDLVACLDDPTHGSGDRTFLLLKRSI